MRNLRQAMAFLTRVPLAPADGEFATPGVVLWFPAAGLLIGVVVGAVYWVTARFIPTTPSAVVAVGAGVLLTGAFHEDGLADTFDALGGGWDREAALRIFKDSRLGTFGVAALVVSILLRITLLATFDALAGLLVLVTAHGVARTVSAATMGLARPAAPGSGTALMAGVGRWHTVGFGVAGLAIGVTFLGPAGIVAVVAAGVAAAILVRWANGRIGGVNGDVLGAIEQVSEIVVLLVAAIAIGYWTVPWWG